MISAQRDCDSGGDSGHARIEAALRDRLAAKAARVEEDIANLERMRQALHHAAACEVHPFTDCAEFRAILGAATA